MAEKIGKTSALVGQSAVYSTSGITSLPAGAAKPKPVKMTDEENIQTGGNPWAKWGDDDDFATQVLEKQGKLSVGKRAVCINADTHYGAGIEFFKREMDGTKILKHPQLVPEWDSFKAGTAFDLEHSNAIEYLEQWYWVAIRCLTNVAKNKIHVVEALDPYFCRKGKRNAQGRIDKLYFSYKFPESPKPEDRIEYPVYDPEKPNAYSEFVIFLEYSTSGKIYYPEPDYYAVYRNGWVDVACSVPEFIKAMYDKSATIKYHIHIPLHFFVNKYKDWHEKTEKDQLKIFKAEQENMDKFLMGKENAHKSFMSVFGLDDNGNVVPGWKIESIQDYMKKDAELPNTAAANQEILFAYGVDPSSIGLGIPGGKNLSGSGSDKREGVKVKQAFLFRERMVTIQMVNFVISFNKIDTKGATPRYIDIDTSQTLDENPTGKQTVVNG